MVLTPVPEARDRIARIAVALAPVELPLEQALGLRVADSVRSDADLPVNDVSAMDGYAVRTSDLNGDALPVAFEIAAGDPPNPLDPGYAARIFTGAAVPPGADTIVQQEKAEQREDGTVRLDNEPEGKHIRRRGEVMAHGQVIAAARTVVTPPLLAAFASGGAATLKVTPKPRIAMVLTGSELVPVEQTPQPGQTRDSNGPMLQALARNGGFPITRIHRAVDRLDALVQDIQNASEEADVVLTTGGVSVGDYDLVPQALKKLDAEVLFHRVAMKPGKPILVARVKGTWIVGLPGNSVSALVGWRLFAWPLLQALSGAPDTFATDHLRVPLAAPTAHRGDRPLYLPAWLKMGDDGLTVERIPWKGSHDIISAAAANALLYLEIGAKHNRGETVEVYPFPWSFDAVSFGQ